MALIDVNSATTLNVLFIRNVMLALVRATKTRSLESANDAKTGEQSIFREYIWNIIRNLITLHFGLANVGM